MAGKQNVDGIAASSTDVVRKPSEALSEQKFSMGQQKVKRDWAADFKWFGERSASRGLRLRAGIPRLPQLLPPTTRRAPPFPSRRARAHRARAGGSVLFIAILWAVLTGYWTALYEIALAVRGTNYMGERLGEPSHAAPRSAAHSWSA